MFLDVKCLWAGSDYHVVFKEEGIKKFLNKLQFNECDDTWPEMFVNAVNSILDKVTIFKCSNETASTKVRTRVFRVLR